MAALCGKTAWATEQPRATKQQALPKPGLGSGLGMAAGPASRLSLEFGVQKDKKTKVQVSKWNLVNDSFCAWEKGVLRFITFGLMCHVPAWRRAYACTMSQFTQATRTVPAAEGRVPNVQTQLPRARSCACDNGMYAGQHSGLSPPPAL